MLRDVFTGCQPFDQVAVKLPAGSIVDIGNVSLRLVKTGSIDKCYPAFYLVLNHTTFNQIKKRHSINYSDGFYIGLLYAVPLVLS